MNISNVRLRDIVKLVLSIVVCEGAGLSSALFTVTAIPTWYASLNKPSFNPPNWLFAPVWTILYLLMGISAFLVWRRGLDSSLVKPALVTFAIQLVLNVLWTMVFFGLKSILFGLVIILGLWAAILITILGFFRISRVAAWLLVPYIIWVSFASVLNGFILMLNR